MKKKILSLLLAGAMSATLLAGCGGAPAEEGGGAPAGGGANVEEEGGAPSGGEEGGAGGEEGGEVADGFTRFEETQTISLAQMNMLPGDNSKVMEAINKIALEKINVQIGQWDQLDVGSYIEQLPKKMSSGASEYDLVMCTAIPMCSFTTWQSQNQLADITDMVDYYAPNAKAMMAQYLPSTTVDGKIYAMPCYRQYNSNIYILMREDVLDEAGLTEQARACKTWDDIEAVMEAVVASGKIPDGMNVFMASDNQGTMMTPGSCILCGNDFSEAIGFDALGDTYKYIYVDPATDTVSNMFATEQYQNVMERLWKWHEKGWLYKDAQNDLNNAGDAVLQPDTGFAFMSTCEYGVEEVKEAQYQKPIVAIKVGEIPITTQTGRQWSWAVPTASQNPEAAVAFMELMWTDPEIENLLVYGIEGEDYNVVDGEAVVDWSKENGYKSSDFFYGNQFASLPGQGYGADFRDRALADMQAAPISKYYGCVVSTNDISDTITNVHEVLKKYQWPMEAGAIDPSTTIPTMQAELDSAGLNDIITFYQDALNAYLGK